MVRIHCHLTATSTSAWLAWIIVLLLSKELPTQFHSWNTSIFISFNSGLGSRLGLRLVSKNCATGVSFPRGREIFCKTDGQKGQSRNIIVVQCRGDKAAKDQKTFCGRELLWWEQKDTRAIWCSQWHTAEDTGEASVLRAPRSCSYSYATKCEADDVIERLTMKCRVDGFDNWWHWRMKWMCL